MFQVHPDPAMRQAGRELSEAADRFFNEFRVNDTIYQAVRSVDLAGADPETVVGVQKLARDMRRAGVELDSAARKQIVELANQVDRDANEFAANISAAERGVVVEGPEALRGLPPEFSRRIPRERMEDSSLDRVSRPLPGDGLRGGRGAPPAASARVPERRVSREPSRPGQAPHRPSRIRPLVGYSDYARYAVEDKMSERPQVVAEFLDRIAQLLDAPVKDDLDRLLARKRKDHPEATQLEDWDGRLWPGGYLRDRNSKKSTAWTCVDFARTSLTPRCATASSTYVASCSGSSSGPTPPRSFGTVA